MTSRPSSSLATLVLLAGFVPAAAPSPADTSEPTAGTGTPSAVFAAFTTEAGAAGVREARLWIDGTDVTAAATVTALRVSYEPREPLAPGEHVARVEVTDALGRAHAKEWTFVVEVPAADLEAVWSEALLVELDRPPRQVRDARLTLRGWTQPLVEVVVRVDDDEGARVTASASGRFEARVHLEPGDHALGLAARRVDTGEDGPELALRVERLGDPEAPSDPPGPFPGSRRAPRLDLRPRLPLGAGHAPLVAGEPTVPSGAPADRRVGREPVDHAPAATSRAGRADTSRATLPDDEGEPPGGGPQVVITKPDDGETLQAGHVTVLGIAPARWRVTVTVDGAAAGDDVANPAGRFTVENVQLGSGEHVLVAVAEPPPESDGQGPLASEPVRVTASGAGGGRFLLAPSPLKLEEPLRGATVARASVQSVRGTAWEGAEVEVDVNGRIVAREVAGLGGRFAIDVPLEPGLNVLVVEASSPDGARMAVSREHAITAPAHRRLPGLPPALRPERPPRAPVGPERAPRPERVDEGRLP